MIKSLYKKAVKHKWNIGFVSNDISSILAGDDLDINWMKHDYADRWFADPFILELTNEKITLLVEEYYDLKERGRISKLEVNRKDYTLEGVKVVLELESHLSFPAIIRKDNNIYLYPENSESNELILYQYDKETDSCQKKEVLSKQPLTDAIYTDLFRKPYIFSTKMPTQNSNNLGVYRYDESMNIFVHCENVEFVENIARMAGDFFMYKGKFYRPAQECNETYGHGISIQEVCYNNGYWNFKEIRRLFSNHPNLELGFHTFNTYGEFIVVDAKGYRYPSIARKLVNLKNGFKKTIKIFKK